MMDEAQVWADMGEDRCRKMVHEFYLRVREDDLIGPMYPSNDWEGAEERLYDFLAMRIGGNPRYIEKRGHPQLRGRHIKFRIGVAERDRWLELMSQAMIAVEVPESAAQPMMAFFEQVADFMRNVPS